MKAIKDIILLVNYSNKQSHSQSISLLNQEFELDKLSFSIQNDKGIRTIEFTPNTSDKLYSIEVKFILEDAFVTDDLYYLFNMLQTNDVAEVKKFNENNGVLVKDVTVMKNKESLQHFNIGLVTAWRFLSFINFAKDSLSIFYSMEDKALKVGETYVLEKFVLDEDDNTYKFLEDYANTVAKLNNVKLDKQIPVGWCSWSCYFGEVSEAKILNVTKQLDHFISERKPNLVQIDDRYQKNGPFCGKWIIDEKKFPNGLKSVANKVNEKNMNFGLWLAPLIVSEDSEFYEELKPLLNTDCNLKLGEVPVHPFNLDKPEVYELLKNIFTQMVNENGSVYFKLDFLMVALKNFTKEGEYTHFESDYSIALYRKALLTIRNTIGQDKFLLACGAPILEGAGIFDGMRVTCDIIWGKNKNHPSYWNIMKTCGRSILLRYFYHRRVFINDPDGLVIRDYHNGDGFNCTYSEARLWATMVALSGGSVLINEELENLSPKRRYLFEQLLPPLGIEAKPLDYFETPLPTSACIEIDENTKLLALFNWDDKYIDIDFNLEKVGFAKALVIRCWEKEIIGVVDNIVEKDFIEHNAALYLVRTLPSEPTFIYSDINIFLGLNVFNSTFADGKLELSNIANINIPCSCYAFYPKGYDFEGEIISTLAEGVIGKIIL